MIRRRPSLSDYDRSSDATPQARQRRREAGRDNRDPETAAREGRMGSGDCWCGEPFGHGWDGKDEGKPHPRWSEPADPPPVPQEVTITQSGWLSVSKGDVDIAVRLTERDKDDLRRALSEGK